MSFAKRQLEEEMARAAEEYRKESICPKCGDEREEITLDHNTFWLCDTCDSNADERDEQYEIDNPLPDYVLDPTLSENYDELWGPAADKSSVFTSVEEPVGSNLSDNATVMVEVPCALARDVMQAVAERIRYHVAGLRDNPLDAKCLADVNALVEFVKKLQQLFPKVNVEF